MKGYDFHRQKPIDNYIVDFFCHELMLVIEIDGYAYLVPFVEGENGRFLKTIIPSRKATRDYLGGGK